MKCSVYPKREITYSVKYLKSVFTHSMYIPYSLVVSIETPTIHSLQVTDPANHLQVSLKLCIEVACTLL